MGGGWALSRQPYAPPSCMQPASVVEQQGGLPQTVADCSAAPGASGRASPCCLACYATAFPGLSWSDIRQPEHAGVCMLDIPNSFARKDKAVQATLACAHQPEPYRSPAAPPEYGNRPIGPRTAAQRVAWAQGRGSREF